MGEEMIIPTWRQCKRRVEHGEENALERFIYDNEPAGAKDEARFRHDLQQAIDYVLTLPKPT